MIGNIDWDKKIKFTLGLDDDEEEAKGRTRTLT